MKEMSDLICGKAAVGGNYNSTRDNTARANKLNVYYYIRHLLTELPKLLDENGNIEQSKLEPLMPWSTGSGAFSSKEGMRMSENNR